MIEIPEAVTLARQISRRFAGKKIARIVTGHSPHKLAWFYGKPECYSAIASGRTLDSAKAVGGMVEVSAGEIRLLYSEGVNLRALAPHQPDPEKHQLLVRFDDGSAVVASVQMYGGMGIYIAGTNDNKIYRLACERPSPLESAFNKAYFRNLLTAPGMEKLSAKAFLATEQRIPGLGNGVLQDILFAARIHPKRKVGGLDESSRETLFRAVKDVIRAMSAAGGRDTEYDLDGNPGGYTTILSQKTVGLPCRECGGEIRKEPYLGGSIYFCASCQRL